jgi:hypothetical protein
MKKLLFNGCSFVAGDAVAWHLYFPYIPWETVLDNASGSVNDNYREYTLNFRKRHNLPAVCASILNTPSVDLSKDGSSNNWISLTTINYILKLSEEEKSNLHVCVGWSDITRRMKWSNTVGCFMNFSSVFYDYAQFRKNKIMKDVSTEVHGYIKETIINNYGVDHLLSFFMDIMLLENFLKANNITYTFWRSLGGGKDEGESCALINTLKNNFEFQIDKISNKNCWISFVDTDLPWAGVNQSWRENLTEDDYINKSNHHPNMNAMNKFANRLTDKIKESVQ